VGAGLDVVTAHLTASGADTAPPRAEDERLEGIVEALTGLARRQDEVTAAVASVLDHGPGPKSIDAVLDRMEQRERSLAARLDRIDASLRTRPEPGPATDPDGKRLLTAMLDAFARQERTFVARLDQLDADVRASASSRSAPPAGGPPLEAVLCRLDEQEQGVARQLDWVGDRLAEVAAHLIPAAEPDPVSDDRFDAVVEALAGIARRQDQLATRFSALAAQRQAAPAPPSPAKEAAERRLATLRAERAQVKVRLDQERLLAARAWEGEPFEDGFDDEEPV